MTNWSAYDTIAGRYDEVWGSRFETVARLLWDRVLPAHGDAVLDIGTGTGIVPQALGARAADLAIAIGCDRSTGMIRVAQSRMHSLRLVAADAIALPFRDSAFDVATASFVLSHLSDYDAGLAEVRRVLKPAGVLAMTSWAAGDDRPSEAWSRFLTGAVTAERIEAAIAQVVPSVACFESAAGVELALTTAGFARVKVQAHNIEGRLSLEQFLADRELTPGARYARDVLGAEEWSRLMDRARVELGRQFGPAFTFARGVLIGVGERT